MERDKELPSFKRAEDITEIIKGQAPKAIQRTTGYHDVNLIETYAERFGQDPDEVLVTIEADTIIMFNVKWKDEAEFKERFETIERMMMESKQ